MSIRCQNWVYEYSEATGNDRLVLLAIADEADDDGTNAFPGIKRIAHKARVPERTVMRSLERLEASGYLVVHRPEQRGRGRFNSYVVAMDNGNPDPRKGATLSPINPPDQTEEKVPERRAKARKGAPPYVNRRRPPDPGPIDPVLNAPAAENEPAAPDLRAGSEVQETPTADPGAQLLAAVAAVAPACCRAELLTDPDQDAGRAALRWRLVLLAAELGPDSAVSLVAGEWPQQVASAMAHANARARAFLERPAQPAPAWRTGGPDPLDGIAEAAAAIAERARLREAELADEPRGGPPPAWKDHLLQRLHGAGADTEGARS